VVNGAPVTKLQECAVALLSRPDAVLSGRAAAWLHGFSGVAKPAVPEITVPSTASGRSSVAKVRRSQHFRHIRVTEVAGLVVASPVETIFRMAEYVGSARLIRFIDDQLLRSADSVAELGDVYFRHQGERLRGMAKLRPILLDRFEDSESPTESALEAIAAALFTQCDLPEIVRQVPLPWAPEAGRVDFLVPDWGVIIELDGRRWHARSEAFESDRARDNAAAAAGYTVLRFTWRMLTTEPDRCLDQIVAAGRA
jgi:very-short-patch-repair endonuclease